MISPDLFSPKCTENEQRAGSQIKSGSRIRTWNPLVTSQPLDHHHGLVFPVAKNMLEKDSFQPIKIVSRLISIDWNRSCISASSFKLAANPSIHPSIKKTWHLIGFPEKLWSTSSSRLLLKAKIKVKPSSVLQKALGSTECRPNFPYAALTNSAYLAPAV